MSAPADSYQALFERRWGHLRRPHVRTLAWLLDAPDLLDPQHPHWEQKIASLGEADTGVAAWLARLDADPSALDAALGERAYTRIGLYAEKLMAFYFRERGQLVAHGLQVRGAGNGSGTVGEFDFLLDAGPGGVEHIEFATKFYLLEGESASRFDTFVGPNLADSLGAKMRKIFSKQLELGTRPEAKAQLPLPVLRARALVKGWLFYPVGVHAHMGGISATHCNGFWCSLAEVPALAGERFVVLPRMQWLAPYRGEGAEVVLDREGLCEALGGADMPALVAVVKAEGATEIETSRGFIVPDNWRARAATRLQATA
ncbi:DUF1853 family protein [Massilia cavernae]|uniref:DUF1853 family protein n=1 Tax=Massilia cavernae TaxID=2320864 RepID=A0A418XUB6_9BURK|nr:DUF1853 family protein [Massilia cavernae]RJG16322.1 DUF1853 family protein [Massilia cavernae]